MNIVLLAILGIVLLIGLVALGIGHKGWSWGTVAFGFLALFAAVGFVYLASRVAERERIWREKVRRLETEVVKVRDGMRLDDRGKPEPIAGEVSLAELEEQKARWYRALGRVNTWRGRSWRNGVFRPAQDNQAGQLIFQLPENAAPNPFINVGAQLYIFDADSADEGGRYLGVVRVRESAVQERELVLSVTPAAPPTDVDKKLWRREYDSVQVFEGLPVDRWFAFYRTRLPDDDSEDVEAGDEEDDAAKPLYPVLPGLRKTRDSDTANAEDLLLDLEEQLDRFEKHGSPVPEDEWRPLAEADGLPAGEYWAAVRFLFAHAMPTEAVGRDSAIIQFEKGDLADLPLEKSLELEKGGVVEIRSVFYRRPLLDMAIAMEGNKVLGKTKDGGQPVEVEVPGGYFLHSRLSSQIGQLEQSLRDLATSKKNAEDTMATVRREEGELNEDLPRWGKDVAAATEVHQSLVDRLDRATKRLDEAWDAVIQMGREYDGGMALLQADAEKRAANRP